jgi:parallel beta-helix repeat protein
MPFVPLAIAFALVHAPGAASADTRIVHPGESIQAAVDAASPGDMIIVKPGEYYESVTIHTDGLTLMAQGHVVLEAPHYGSSSCYLPGHDVGICIVAADFNPSTGTYTNRVRNVTVTGFRIVEFEGDGIFGFGTENLTVSRVTAIDNTAYGLASFDGIGTTFSSNTVSGSHDAGIYVGDSLNANAVVSHNRVLNNAFGILLRHSRKAVVSDNDVSGNCLGVFLLADGQAGGSGEIAVFNNAVTANNDVCAQFAAVGFLPILGGGGIVLAGSQHNTLFQNDVKNNGGTTLFSGGIVMIATPRANGTGSFDPSTNNLVILNRSHGNDPGDIVQDAASTPNVVLANKCGTSVPDGACGS